MAVRDGEPLIGITFVEGGESVTRFFSDEADADAAVAAQPPVDALALAGAWRDLDWDETIAALDRIRHESKPTLPIDDL